MCFSKKKGQKKEVHSVHVHLNSHVDVVEELEFLKNNYYQNSYLKLFNELKKPESKTENPTSDNIEAQSPITGKNQLIPGNSSCLIAFQSKSDSASAERKISEIAEAGSMEQSGTSRACVEKNEQPTFDKNVNISEEVADSIRAPRIIESGAKGGAVAMVTIGRNEYFVETNNVIPNMSV